MEYITIFFLYLWAKYEPVWTDFYRQNCDSKKYLGETKVIFYSDEVIMSIVNTLC